MVTFRLRFFSNRPKEAAMIPLPREETTPPVTKMNLVMKDPPTKQDSPNDGKTKRALLQKGGSHFLTRYIPNPVSAQFVVYLVERGIVKGGVEALLQIGRASCRERGEKCEVSGTVNSIKWIRPSVRVR